MVKRDTFCLFYPPVCLFVSLFEGLLRSFLFLIPDPDPPAAEDLLRGPTTGQIL